jgi:hypothetical protein
MPSAVIVKAQDCEQGHQSGGQARRSQSGAPHLLQGLDVLHRLIGIERMHGLADRARKTGGAASVRMKTRFPAGIWRKGT